MTVATYGEAFKEYARNAGQQDPTRCWILTPWDTWERNPFYTGPYVPHPEDDTYDPLTPEEQAYADRAAEARDHDELGHDDHDEVPF